MLEDESKSFMRFQRSWQSVRSEFVQTVPEEIALCEFDCRKVNCTVEEWKMCKRRIQKAAGELRPAA
jgi:hypothetical protein